MRDNVPAAIALFVVTALEISEAGHADFPPRSWRPVLTARGFFPVSVRSVSRFPHKEWRAWAVFFGWSVGAAITCTLPTKIFHRRSENQPAILDLAKAVA